MPLRFGSRFIQSSHSMLDATGRSQPAIDQSQLGGRARRIAGWRAHGEALSGCHKAAASSVFSSVAEFQLSIPHVERTGPMNRANWFAVSPEGAKAVESPEHARPLGVLARVADQWVRSLYRHSLPRSDQGRRLDRQDHAGPGLARGPVPLCRAGACRAGLV